jgi:hypothetical protein
MDAFGTLFADDCVNHQVSAVAPPPGACGKQLVVVGFLGAQLKAFPDLNVLVLPFRYVFLPLCGQFENDSICG